MAKYIPKPEPKTSAEKYWYAKGLSEGLQGRTREITANQTRADAKWAEIKTMEARLTGTMQLCRVLHDLIQAATGGKY
jgi:hypothetical protein